MANLIPSPAKLHPFTGKDLPWLLEAQAEKRPDHPFLIFEPFDSAPRTWTYARFLAAVQSVAAGLVARGVCGGDFVLLHMDNCDDFLIAWHACSRAGAVVVTTNTRSSLDELSYYIAHSGARFALTQPSYDELVREAGTDLLKWIASTRTNAGAAPDVPRSDASIPFEEVRADAATLPDRTPDPLAPNSVQYTSGTTSRPKGVVWTHANALWGARQNAIACGVRPEDIGHAFLPLFHTNALSYSHLSTLWAGATLVLQPRFSASRYWDVAIRHKCTWGIHIPFSLKALLGKPAPNHSFTRWGLGAFDPAPVLQAFGVPCIGWFGMTETVSLPIISNSGLPGREMSMGAAAPEYGVAVRDEDGADVAFGVSGELHIRGVPGISLFKEYLNNPEATAQAFAEDGWFRTGDLVTAYEDGQIVFNGRNKDMMRIGAENVAESEIERVILSVGGISDVAVVGRPDPMLDEVPVAFVMPFAEDPELTARITAACEKQLADFKRPRDIVIVNELPRVTLGKIDKKSLRAKLREDHERIEG